MTPVKPALAPALETKKFEFTTALAFGGQYYLNQPPEGRSRANKHELSAFMGFKRDISLASKIKAKFALEFRFLNLNLEFPDNSPSFFEKPNVTSLTTGLWFRFSTPKEPSKEEKKANPPPLGSREKAYGRWGFTPWFQVGTVLRNFDVPVRSEEGVDPEGPKPMPQECDNVGSDNPFNTDKPNCDLNQAGTVVVYQGQERWAADFIAGLNIGFKVLARKPGKDLLNLNAEGRFRGQVPPGVLEGVVPRLAFRALAGASTVFHPKTAKFLNLAVRGGPEINLMNGRVDWYFMVGLQIFLNTKPEGL